MLVLSAHSRVRIFASKFGCGSLKVRTLFAAVAAQAAIYASIIPQEQWVAVFPVTRRRMERFIAASAGGMLMSTRVGCVTKAGSRSTRLNDGSACVMPAFVAKKNS